MRRSVLHIALMLLPCFGMSQNIKQDLLNEINEIRSNPQAFFQSQDTVLGEYTAKLPLQWDDSLALESQKHADMLLKDQSVYHSGAYGYSESVGGSMYTDNIVKEFILEIDAIEGEDGHRNQLLSKDNAHTRIGIGVAEGRDEYSEWLPVYYIVIRTY